MKLMALTLLTLTAAHSVAAQGRKTRFPIGLYTTGKSDIYGISAGIGSDNLYGFRYGKRVLKRVAYWAGIAVAADVHFYFSGRPG